MIPQADATRGSAARLTLYRMIVTDVAPHPELLVDDTAAARRTSRVLMLVAAVALAGNGLLTSPAQFSPQHAADQTLLRPVVTWLALGGEFPTPRGVEVRNLVFYVAAGLLALVAGIRLIGWPAEPRISGDDLLDVRRRAGRPYFWWILLLLVSVLTSVFSHAPDICKGQATVRMLHAAWWWPLAAMLTPTDARRLASWLVLVLGATAALGVWYYVVRQSPPARLQYPIGNELWLAATLLPALFIAAGWLGQRLREVRFDARLLLFVLAGCIAASAIALTRSRSAGAGVAAGIFVLVFYMARRRTRRVVVLVALLAAIAGSIYMQQLRTRGVMGQRAHSIRARLNYEWSYALTLWFTKPIMGHGDGAYAMLAGQIGRTDQLEDPNTMSFEDGGWIAHAHNEYLELLADLGLVGCLAFIAAIAVTLYRAVRYFDERRSSDDPADAQWLVVGLAAALVALAVEEFGSVALREPGCPPVFLTVWACLWAMVRRGQRLQVTHAEEQRLPLAAMRIGGAVAAISGVILGYYGVQDWRAARARHDVTALLEQNDYDAAIETADFAGQWQLDPFQRNRARMIAVWARSLKLDAIVQQPDAVPQNDALELGRTALVKLNELERAAPRFLGTARRRWELTRNLAVAYDRRGESNAAQGYAAASVEALLQYRRDEPFHLAIVQELWRVAPQARAVERLLWLRAVMRSGEISRPFVDLFASMDRLPDFPGAMNDLFQLARQDEQRPPDEWQDVLTPETFRLAALARALSGRLDEAAQLAAEAADLYKRAGPRLFAAHSAALHEVVRYRFKADPTAAAEQNLADLARAQTLRGGPTSPDTPLPEPLGWTRLDVFLAAHREVEALQQIARLPDDAWPDDLTEPRARLAHACTALGRRWVQERAHLDLARRVAERAAQLAPDRPDPWALRAEIALITGHDDAAAEAIGHIMSQSHDRAAAEAVLNDLRERYPDRSVWDRVTIDG